MDRSALLGDIVDLAIGIEKKGAEFYMQASDITKSESTRNVLRELADIEKEHGKSFSTLKNTIMSAAESSADTESDRVVFRYLESWREYVLGKMASTSSSLNGGESDEDMLGIALSLEKDSIAYYAGLSTVMTGEHRDTVDRIIREEMDHYTTLQKTLSTISAIRQH